MEQSISQIAPGIYYDLPSEEYHGDTGSISKSGLDLIHKCPALYEYQYLHGNRPEPTKAMIIGSATHMAVFEPHKFGQSFIEAPETNRRTNAGKLEYEAFAARSAGKTVPPIEDSALVLAISRAVHAHPVAKQILSDGEAEVSIFQDIDGCLVKVRPDWMAGDLLVDLKTTQSAHPKEFAKACANFRYHVQAALYLDVCNTYYQTEKFRSFLFIAVEKTPPFQVAVYYADSAMISRGRSDYRDDLYTYRDCQYKGSWPGYNQGRVEPISLPAWA